MTSPIVGNFIVNTGKLQKAGLAIIPSTVGVYEVLRVIDGVPLFWEDHFRRLLNSLAIARWDIYINQSIFTENVRKLIIANKLFHGNIKIEIFQSGATHEIYFYFIPHHYPNSISYKNGVSVGMFKGERTNPNAKIHQYGLREKANQLIKEKGLFEVLLVDKYNQVTEGSRTNVFFLKKDVFYTSPDELVLPGVTRQKVIKCIHEMGGSLVKKVFDVSDLSDTDAVFLTGTSPKIVPVCKIDSFSFGVGHDKMRKLMVQYDQFIKCYVMRNKPDFIS